MNLFKNTWWNRNLVGGHALFQYCHRIASGWVGLPSVYRWSLAAISKVAYIWLDKNPVKSFVTRCHFWKIIWFFVAAVRQPPVAQMHRSSGHPFIHSKLWNFTVFNTGVSWCCGFLFTFWFFFEGVFVTWRHTFFIWNAKMLQFDVA